VSAKEAKEIKTQPKAKAAPAASAPAPKAPAPRPEAEPDYGGHRIREGIVASDKMQKTIIVEVTRLMRHPQFNKVIRQKIRYAAHDEKNEAKIGDKVQIVETRPLSKRKRWRLVKVLGK
jgi:small subunit ribosomal protein S17